MISLFLFKDVLGIGISGIDGMKGFIFVDADGRGFRRSVDHLIGFFNFFSRSKWVTCTITELGKQMDFLSDIRIVYSALF